MVRVVKTGGTFFVRDLLRPESDGDVRHLVQLHTGQENEHSQQMFEDSLRAALSLAEIRDMVAGFGFSPDSVSQTTDRHWTWSALKT